MGKYSLTALALSPGRADACSLDISERTAVPRDFVSTTWEEAGSDLTTAVPAIRELLSAQDSDRSGERLLLLALDGSWTISARTAVPPGKRSEIQEYLRLWVEREWPRENYGALRWSWVPTGDTSSREAFVVLLRESTIAPIEAVATELGIRIVYTTVSELAVAAGIETTAGESLLLQARAVGASILKFDKHGPREFSWLAVPISLPLSPLARHHLSEAFGGNAPAGVYVCGSASSALVKSECLGDSIVSLDTAIPLTGAWREGIQAEYPEAANILRALSDVYLRKLPVLNLGKEVNRGDELKARVTEAMSHRRTPRLAAGIFILLAVLLFGGWALQSALYAMAQKSARAIELDEVAAATNTDLLKKLATERRPFLEILSELQKAKGDVVLDKFDLDEKSNVSLAGKCPSFAAVEAFVVRLNESRRFTNAVTQNTARINDREVSFTIRCRAEVRR